MPKYEGLQTPFEPNWQGLVDNILRKGTPDRCYNIELFHDGPLRDAIIKMFDLEAGLDKSDPHYQSWLHIKFLRFLGFDYIYAGPTGQNWQFISQAVDEDHRIRSDRSRGAEIGTQLDLLTRREREVMKWVVDGYSNRQIAVEFGISARTVEVHRARVMEKMGADSLSDLVRMACISGCGSESDEDSTRAVAYRVEPDTTGPRKLQA